jgi:glycosyltransferase involved in cell wall biosynthesis
VGDGPHLKTLKSKYPEVEYAGKKSGIKLAEYYQKASVLVFPSQNDTFGVVNIESIACGTPVAAYPVTGPKDIIEQEINGYLSNDLSEAVIESLKLDRELVYQSSFKWSWESCYSQFKQILLAAKS